MRCQSKVNCNSQVCWRQGNLQELWLQKEEDDGFDGCLGCENDKIWKQSLFVQKKTCQSQRWSQDCEQRNWLGWYHCWDFGIPYLPIPEIRILYQLSVPGSKHTSSKLHSLPRLFPISLDCLPGFWFLAILILCPIEWHLVLDTGL